MLIRGSNVLFECTGIFYQNVVASLDAEDVTNNTGFGLGIAVDSKGFFLELGVGHTRSVDWQTGVNYSPKFINAIPMTVQIGYVD